MASKLDRVLNCVSLPSLPTVAMEVLELTRDHNVRIQQLARSVENDPAICAKILKTVNSSFYALSQPCPTIERAVAYLGLNTVKSLVLGFSLVDWSDHSESGFDLLNFWRRSVYSAAAARRIVLTTRACDPDEAFIAALMQDVGMLAAHIALGEAYDRIVASHQGGHETLSFSERDALGFDHAEAGAKLAERWKLPAQHVAAIRLHQSASGAGGGAHDAMVRSVILAGHAAAALTESNPGEALGRYIASAAAWFKLPEPEARQLLVTMTADAQSLASLFQLNTGESPDVQAILGEAQDAATRLQVAAQREAEQLRQNNDDLNRTIHTDALTGAGNRRMFDETLAAAFESAKSTGGTLSVVFIDADKFKSLNDTHGHQAGDEVLKELARRMTAVIGPRGTVCRYGGEEFAIILPGASRVQCATLAEQVRKNIERHLFAVDQAGAAAKSLPVTASMGVACYEPNSAGVFKNQRLLVQAADKAVYAAKAAGRNCVRVFTLKQPAPAAPSAPVAKAA
jgi:diguanylate cyclase (GGDEF)-like protein